MIESTDLPGELSELCQFPSWSGCSDIARGSDLPVLADRPFHMLL